MSIVNRNGINFRELVLVDKVKECNDIMSFYFKDKKNQKLTKHKPGQFLPFQIQTQNPKYKGVMRTYSLSMAPNESMYRISVKKLENGLISSYLHDNLEVGDVIEAMEPAGIFTVKEESKNRPLILISAGIGITPLLSMFYEESKNRDNIYFVQAVQNSSIHPFKNDIDNICKYKNLSNTVFYSNPLDTDKEGIDYDFTGYVNKEWIRNNLPLDGDFYFCGPSVFMKSLESNLLDLGVKKEFINYEFF
ncbi:MAG TPA: oxidoreductase [Romboutsia timonensis]|uniref:nitric oxide dioxygenase n=1 Tax=Romboutsia timonensis TaxID=1776391 RepID=A0A921N0W7_9FIRM|nr:oxidoreductase [Romboutsia timonensis]